MDLLQKDSRALKIVEEFPVPTETMIQHCVEQTGISSDTEAVCTYVLNGSRLIRTQMQSLKAFMPENTHGLRMKHNII